ncbi:MAG: DUF2244 domain-containing protein [Rhodobacteraceae bacterium]|jgi:uncharacterized membrane protein|uniref:Integral membrane protein n=1 Tax=Salipiger profundus TaxID=1229727 RepID=A0A1U7D6P0_9RHOB|nr:MULTISPECIES: DUF2244 domain-containing protein [Salipiger]APX23778.1 integral membrane protein [Salipiger profundus]MAB07065.1 DUF2244 domain-containing protein [Paracoccaceae bacterium]SFD29373.1 Uncharacterized membrane protein [Salipiger profundus]
MPYRWEHTTSPAEQAELHLWPHQSLSAHGFSIFILSFFLLALMPFFGLLGTVLLWGLLPFMLAAVAGLWFAIKRNSRDRQVLEILTLGPELTRLERHNPRGPDQDWQSNTYWVRVSMHEKGGPVPYYVTLKGSGREVEIGAFLSEDERKALFAELTDRVRLLTQP